MFLNDDLNTLINLAQAHAEQKRQEEEQKRQEEEQKRQEEEQKRQEAEAQQKANRLQTIKDMGIKIVITGSRVENSPFANGYHRQYRIKLTKGNKEFTFTYHDSVYNYCNNIKLNKLDTLYSIIIDMNCYDNARDFEDFANNFGYEVYDDNYTGYNKKALRIYEACERTSNKLHGMFTDSELEKLQDLFQDY